MEPVFPTLLSYGFIAPLLIRASLAFFFIAIGLAMIRTKYIGLCAYFEANKYPLATTLPWLLSATAILTGTFFVFGFFTQVASLTATYLLLNLMIIEHREEHLFNYSQLSYLLLMVLAAALIFLGPGAIALD